MKHITSLLKIGDKIFLSALLGQALIGGFIAITLVSIHLFSQDSKQSEVISGVFKKWESEITESSYIHEVVNPSEIGDSKVLRGFESALLANGIRIKAQFVDCGLYPEAISLNMGTRKLKNCVRIVHVREHVAQSIFMAIIVAMGSILVMGLVWLYIRKSLENKFYLPLLESLKNEAHASAVGKISRQLAHDVRSPIATITSILDEKGHLDNQAKEILIAAATRIREISNDLLSETPLMALTSNKIIPTDLSILLEEIINEKSQEFINSEAHISIQLKNELDTAIANVIPSNFKRILSNLINNAFEAMSQTTGLISVSLIERNDSNYLIEISDQGIGIPKNILSKIGNEGFSTKGTNGLGIAYAKSSISEWGGSLTIDSIENQGTVVTLSLKKVKPQNQIVLLDDSSLVHQTWKYLAKKHNLEIHSYSNVEDFMKDIDSISQDSNIFIDQELGEEVFGTNIAAQLIEQQFSNIYLCTAREASEIELPLGVLGIIDKAFPVHIVAPSS